nr:unnamed protein product [Callosobruchus chinensis]
MGLTVCSVNSHINHLRMPSVISNGVEMLNLDPMNLSSTQTHTDEKTVKLKRAGVNLRGTRNYLKEYCQNTSIHGFKYLSDKRSLCERYLWLLLISLSIAACGFLISRIYYKYITSPVIVSFATKESPLYAVPFPAVTICPMTKARKSVYNFTRVVYDLMDDKNITDEEQLYGQYLSLVCNYGTKYFVANDTFDDDFYEKIDEVKLNISEYTESCAFLTGSPMPCRKLFEPIILDESVCYTFNMLDRTAIFQDEVVHFKDYHSTEKTLNWDVDKGYSNVTDAFSTYPYNAYLSGYGNGLHITFKQLASELDYLCLQTLQGFSVSLHAPHVLPQLNKEFFQVSFGDAVMALVLPKVMKTSQKVRKYHPNTRECYFTNEKPLRYFKQYTPIYLKLMQLQYSVNNEKDTFFCDCKPSCVEIMYEAKLSQSTWNYKERYVARNRKPINDSYLYARLSVFFKQDSFLTSERNELYGPTDFLANFGGLLGLFTGFSLLSLAEIVYFLSVRICCNVRLYKFWAEYNTNSMDSNARNEIEDDYIRNPYEDDDDDVETPSEMEITRRRERRSIRNSRRSVYVHKEIKGLDAYFNEYCATTTMHGFKYLVENRSRCEKYFWAILILVAIAICCILISRILLRFMSSPIMVSFSTKESPINSVPFPAVTICPVTKAKKSIFNFTKAIHDLQDGKEISDEDISDFADSCKYMSHWQGRCDSFFWPILLDDGVCYTFNMLDKHHIFHDDVIHYKDFHHPKTHWNVSWNIDEGYTNRTIFTYPFRAYLPGYDNGLHIEFQQAVSELDYLCLDHIQGFAILLHAPHVVPQVRKYHIKVAFGDSVIAQVQPYLIKTPPEVRKYHPDIRDCYFTDEKFLTYFKQYTPENCRLECITNFTLEKCGCVSFFMPRKASTPICGMAKFSCVQKAESELKYLELHNSLNAGKVTFFCDCRPACVHLKYDADHTQAQWHYKEMYFAKHRKPMDESLIHARLSILFKYDSFLTSERNELYGPIDFLANFGGLLGLFTGFSLLSLIEIIYFLSLRIWCNVRLYNFWAGNVRN